MVLRAVVGVMALLFTHLGMGAEPPPDEEPRKTVKIQRSPPELRRILDLKDEAFNSKPPLWRALEEIIAELLDRHAQENKLMRKCRNGAFERRMLVELRQSLDWEKMAVAVTEVKCHFANLPNEEPNIDGRHLAGS